MVEGFGSCGCRLEVCSQGLRRFRKGLKFGGGVLQAASHRLRAHVPKPCVLRCRNLAF